jgi:putative oxidoreductase
VRYGDIGVWLLQIVLAAVFLYEGVDKFSERRLWLRVFDEIGFGQWFRYFTGIVEVSAAVMLLIPRTTLIAVGLLVCTMIGALLVHVVLMGVGPQTIFVAIVMVMLGIVGAKKMNRDRRKAHIGTTLALDVGAEVDGA